MQQFRPWTQISVTQSTAVNTIPQPFLRLWRRFPCGANESNHTRLWKHRPTHVWRHAVWSAGLSEISVPLILFVARKIRGIAMGNVGNICFTFLEPLKHHIEKPKEHHCQFWLHLFPSYTISSHTGKDQKGWTCYKPHLLTIGMTYITHVLYIYI